MDNDDEVSYASGVEIKAAKMRQQRGYWRHNFMGNQKAHWVFLYVMESANIVKVGISRDINKRHKAIYANSPLPVRIVSWQTVRSDVAGWAEHVAHAALYETHDHDEWFRCSTIEASRAIQLAAARANDIPEEWVRENNDPKHWYSDLGKGSKTLMKSTKFLYYEASSTLPHQAADTLLVNHLSTSTNPIDSPPRPTSRTRRKRNSVSSIGSSGGVTGCP